MSNSKKSNPALMLGLVSALAVMGAVGFVLLGSSPDASVGPAPAAAGEARAVTAPATSAPPPRVDSAPRSTATASEESKSKPKQNRLARDLAREQIWSALGRKHELSPAASGSAAPSPDAAAKLPELDPEYIRTAIREQLLPVALDCYDTVLEQDAEAAGELIFDFTIIGDEEIGGVVDEVALAEGSTLDNEFLRECMSESLLGVTFPPPAEGGRVEVTYPFEFAPG